MKSIILIILLFLSSLSLSAWAQEQQMVVPFTLADRDRIIRIETKMDIKFDAVNAKFEADNERFDTIYWLLGVIVALNLFILGYTIWDRRTALRPALDKAIEADAKGTISIRTLRDYSKKHPDLAEILKSHGIL